MNGVQSTTRFRKQASFKRMPASVCPAPQRQRSGAKGGRVPKNLTAKYYPNDYGYKNDRYRQRPSSRQSQQQRLQLHHLQQPEQVTLICPQSSALMPQLQASNASFFMPLSDDTSPAMGGVIECAGMPSDMQAYYDFTPWADMDCLDPLENNRFHGLCEYQMSPMFTPENDTWHTEM